MLCLKVEIILFRNNGVLTTVDLGRFRIPKTSFMKQETDKMPKLISFGQTWYRRVVLDIQGKAPILEFGLPMSKFKVYPTKKWTLDFDCPLEVMPKCKILVQ